MTKEEALYEICELAGTLIHAASQDCANPPELFSWCESIQDEITDIEGVSGSPFSADYEKCNKWLMEKIRG